MNFKYKKSGINVILILAICSSLLLCACSGSQSTGMEDETEAVGSQSGSETAESKQESIMKIKETDRFIFFSSKQDAKEVEKMEGLLESRYPEICRDLGYDYQYRIIFEVYPDQKSFDENVPYESSIGFPALSADRRIWMVSPKSPIKVDGIPYDERLLMSVHEFTHLMINEINEEAPMWLQEGIASYEGSKKGYEEIILNHIQKMPPADFDLLADSYYEHSYPDVFSYFAVKYIVENIGYETLRQIVRNPDTTEQILKMDDKEFENNLNRYIDQIFKSNEAQK